MDFLNNLKNSLEHIKNISAESGYLDECFEVMNNKKEHLELLDEKDVLEIDKELNSFFDKNVGIQIVSSLRVTYNIYKENLRKHQKSEKTKCTERNKKKFEKKLNNAQWELDNLSENREDILNAKLITEIELNSAVAKTIRTIENLENTLNNIDSYCTMHGIETDFGELVIKNMNEFIKEKQKERF